MTEAEFKELKKGIALTASYYGKDLKPEVIQMMAEDLKDLPFVKISEAYRGYRTDPKNRAMPLPAQIRALVAPAPTSDAQAREIVERIKEAISKFGYADGAGARKYIGELGWKIVQGLGGWTKLCESDFLYNSSLIAQARNRAEDLINFGPGINETLPQIAAPQEKQQIEANSFIQGLIHISTPKLEGA